MGKRRRAEFTITSLLNTTLQLIDHAFPAADLVLSCYLAGKFGPSGAKAAGHLMVLEFLLYGRYGLHLR